MSSRSIWCSPDAATWPIRAAEDDVDGQEQQQDAAADAHARQADTDATEEIVSEEDEDQ
jgi:hypothetical protein